MTKEVMAGIDLHSNNAMLAIVDEDGKRLTHRKVDCNLQQVVDFLRPYKGRIKSIAVESTFNWYWLVDGLRAASYPVVLANPAKIEQHSGIKHADDKNDAYFLAELQRLNILPTGYVYDPRVRPIRDLLRRRMLLVQQRTALMLSFKSLYNRTTGSEMPLKRLKELSAEECKDLYTHPANQLIARLQREQIDSLTESIEEIEKAVGKCARKLPGYTHLVTVPGIGPILGMTIAMEVGEISRFKSAGDFASYCRTVGSKRMSNEKSKGENNGKCGNKYLAWAFVEAANFARRFDDQSRQWFDRKAARGSKVIATKALACKLAKAAWHVMTDQKDYDSKRVFGS